MQLIPVAIAYDQIQDVGDYVAEQRGAAKQKESLGWFLRLIRRLHRNYGDIHVRFGEPLSLSKALGPPAQLERRADADERHLSRCRSSPSSRPCASTGSRRSRRPRWWRSRCSASATAPPPCRSW